MTPLRSRKSSHISSRETPDSGRGNFNESSCQSPIVRIVKSDNGDPGTTFVCKCARCSATCGRPTPWKSPVSVVTYKKKLGPDKMLVVRQELEKPRFTVWIMVHAFLFLLFLFLIYVVIQVLAHSLTKVEEILSIATLLLIILVFFRPRYFIPLLIFDPNRWHDKQDFHLEDDENAQCEKYEQ